LFFYPSAFSLLSLLSPPALYLFDLTLAVSGVPMYDSPVIGRCRFFFPLFYLVVFFAVETFFRSTTHILVFGLLTLPSYLQGSALLAYHFLTPWWLFDPGTQGFVFVDFFLCPWFPYSNFQPAHFLLGRETCAPCHVVTLSFLFCCFLQDGPVPRFVPSFSGVFSPSVDFSEQKG